MAYSTQRSVSDGTLRVLGITIEFFDKSEITAYFDNVPTTAYVWATDNSLRFNANVPNGVEVLIRRTTDLSSVRHVFSLGAQFKDSTLDDDFKQILHIAQEAVEGANVGDIYSDLNMHGNKITNVGPAVADGDAVSLGQVRTESQGAWQAASQAAASAATAAAAVGTTAASASAAAGSASAAAGSASAAAGSATTASTAAGTATTQAGNSANSATLAQRWAAELEDVVVAGGQYSAFHYSRKAAASATTATTQAGTATTQANRARDEADRAQGYAAALNLPPATGNAGLTLGQNITATGLEYKAIPQQNLLINSAFQIFQRALIFANPVGYTADRWRVSAVGTGTYFAAAQTYGSRRAFRLSVTTVGSLSQLVLEQRVESVECVADGAYVTVSFRVASTVAAGSVNVSLLQNFGSGGSAEVITSSTAKPVTVANTFVKYEFTIKLPTVVGKTIAANGSYLSVQLRFTGFGNQMFDIQTVKAEESFRATPYEYPREGDEMLRCFRYFWRTQPIDWNWSSPAVGYLASRYTKLPVAMRGTAVLTTNANTPSSSGGADLNRLSVALSAYQDEVRWICYSTIASESIFIGFNSNNFINVDAEI
ncbi:tail fiber [Pseudomonas phage Bertil]|uniref:Tail fiber n=1 Tax=Pseudomonas phage Bertil TaxID=2801385 RepID=A0A7T8EQE7_9CAUD|nr:tail fiber [Pseudomonas phage Bertil]QQO90910.1 tail fiber protein [Pseudomonas phage Strit]